MRTPKTRQVCVIHVELEMSLFFNSISIKQYLLNPAIRTKTTAHVRVLSIIRYMDMLAESERDSVMKKGLISYYLAA